jgi:hypothetical protein
VKMVLLPSQSTHPPFVCRIGFFFGVILEDALCKNQPLCFELRAYCNTFDMKNDVQN